ncbi:DUF2599 domain-containing protein [Mycobacterium talmoniae]|nr:MULTISPECIES: DUF2599 domain-containing protein [Mycobacterium]TDH52929.1 DUF2599 domain-containing protein [Mycobacterium eburneum]
MTAPVAVAAALLFAAPASADESPTQAPYAPPFVDHTEWVQWAGKPSLRVYPTAAGRAAAGDVGTGAQGDEAWAEVLTLAPDADTPGMRAQFLCHWQWAEFAQPGKTSWNLEPWRPVVDDGTMLAAGCNPGGAEEPF